MKSAFLASTAIAVTVSISSTIAFAGTVVVSHDEWALSNTGFGLAPDTGTFVGNLVAEFGNNILGYSNNFSLTGTSLATAMTNAGATYTSGLPFAFTLANISPFSGIFLAGNYLNATELGDLATYVANGGNVYISGGTGIGGPTVEAAAWNSFLAAFGVQMNGTNYDGISGVIAVSGDPLFNGVAGLYSDNGNALSGGSVVCCGNNGMYAVFRDVAPIPVPASGLLLIGALGGLALARRPKAA